MIQMYYGGGNINCNCSPGQLYLLAATGWNTAVYSPYVFASRECLPRGFIASSYFGFSSSHERISLKVPHSVRCGKKNNY